MGYFYSQIAYEVRRFLCPTIFFVVFFYQTYFMLKNWIKRVTWTSAILKLIYFLFFIIKSASCIWPDLCVHTCFTYSTFIWSKLESKRGREEGVSCDVLVFLMVMFGIFFGYGLAPSVISTIQFLGFFWLY